MDECAVDEIARPGSGSWLSTTTSLRSELAMKRFLRLVVEARQLLRPAACGEVDARAQDDPRHAIRPRSSCPSSRSPRRGSARRRSRRRGELMNQACGRKKRRRPGPPRDRPGRRTSARHDLREEDRAPPRRRRAPVMAAAVAAGREASVPPAFDDHLMVAIAASVRPPAYSPRGPGRAGSVTVVSISPALSARGADGMARYRSRTCTAAPVQGSLSDPALRDRRAALRRDLLLGVAGIAAS